MNTTLNDFLTYFGLDDLLAVSSSVTVAEFLGLVVVCFVALTFCIVSIRVVTEFIKLLLDNRKFI